MTLHVDYGYVWRGKWLKCWKWQDHLDCPRYSQPITYAQHILLCNAITAITQWDFSLLKLKTWLQSNDCDMEMVNVITLSLQAWHDGILLPALHSDNQLLIMALNQQDQLSWYSLLCGFPASGWRIVQHDHLLRTSFRKSSILWMSKFQCWIWEIAWDLWEHRNIHLHNDDSSIHRTDQQCVVSEILRECNAGIALFPLLCVLLLSEVSR